jgi:hypothetical protein
LRPVFCGREAWCFAGRSGLFSWQLENECGA